VKGRTPRGKGGRGASSELLVLQMRREFFPILDRENGEGQSPASSLKRCVPTGTKSTLPDTLHRRDEVCYQPNDSN